MPTASVAVAVVETLLSVPPVFRRTTSPKKIDVPEPEAMGIKRVEPANT
jgi:hypothetical protein